VAVHKAFHNCDGTDPYDGIALDGEQLMPINGGDRLNSSLTHQKCLKRISTVGHLHQKLIAKFEILSRQTHTAKNEMTSDEYLSHCIAVVSFRQIAACNQQRTYFEDLNSNRAPISSKQ
jgi:hypothetical protein